MNTKLLRKRQLTGIGCGIAAVLILVPCLSAKTELSGKEGLTPDDTVVILATGEEEKVDSMDGTAPEESGIYHDGVYSGSAMGMNAAIRVNVTVENDIITDIVIESSYDDEPYFSDAMVVIDDILAANSTNVDTVSGATWSSGGILDAVDDALEKAKK